MKPLLVVVASQLLFTAGDLLARLKMRQHGFDRQLRPLRSATIAINGTTHTFAPVIPDPQQTILDAIRDLGFPP